jgi:hypothetical protein
MIIVDDKIERRHERGDVREDGKIFWNYGKMYKNGEYWLTPEKFEHVSNQRKKTSKKYAESNLENHKAYLVEYREKNKETINSKAREYANKNREKFREVQKNYYTRNRETILKRKKEYRLKNIEKHRAKDREYIKKNLEKHRESAREWKRKNKQRAKESLKSWISRNKDRYKVLLRKGSAKRRALKMSKTPMLNESQSKIIEVFYEQRTRLEKRLGIKFHIDHIVPLARGGHHMPSNLQVLPARLNLMKKDSNSYRWEEMQIT